MGRTSFDEDFAFSLCTTDSDQKNRRIRAAQRDLTGAEVLTMPSVALERMRRLRLLIAVMAIVPTECNVLCNPFSPLQILRWEQQIDVRTTGREFQRTLTAARQSQPNENSHHTTSAGVKHDRDDGRQGVELPLEIDDLVAVRPRMPVKLVIDFAECVIYLASTPIPEVFAVPTCRVPDAVSSNFGSPFFRMRC